MDRDISFFLPCRLGSQRVLNKNTRDFAGIKGGLLYLKLKQLLKLKIKIILSTDDEEVIKIGESFKSKYICIDYRPKHLCLSSTSVLDLIMHVPKVVDTTHVFWLHTTTPFVSSSFYLDAIEVYFKVIEQGYDSVMSVNKLQSFLWNDELKEIINFDRTKIKYPQTQDLEPLYEINHSFYAMSLKNYLKFEDRIGVNPFLYELNKKQSIDIDWQEDFDLAELIYLNNQNEI
jgi:CMP-N-acetylneuraminic acid synthetase